MLYLIFNENILTSNLQIWFVFLGLWNQCFLFSFSKVPEKTVAAVIVFVLPDFDSCVGKRAGEGLET